MEFVTSKSLTTAPLLGEPLAVEFMNTIWADRSGVHDALASDAEVLAWLRAVHPRLPRWATADRWLTILVRFTERADRYQGRPLPTQWRP